MTTDPINTDEIPIWVDEAGGVSNTQFTPDMRPFRREADVCHITGYLFDTVEEAHLMAYGVDQWVDSNDCSWSFEYQGHGVCLLIDIMEDSVPLEWIDRRTPIGTTA
jgi:hypothetical protein